MVEEGAGGGQQRVGVVIQTLKGKLRSSGCLWEVVDGIPNEGTVRGADSPVDGLSKSLRYSKQKPKLRGQARIPTELHNGREVSFDPLTLESHQRVVSRSEHYGENQPEAKSSLTALLLPKTGGVPFLPWGQSPL